MKKRILNVKKLMVIAILLAFPLIVIGCSHNGSDDEVNLTASNVSGRVVDNNTGEPLENSIVRVGEEITSTNHNGFFVVENLKAGEHEIGVGKLDNKVMYEEYNSSINIDGGQDIKLDEIELSQKPNTLEAQSYITGFSNVEYISTTGPNNYFALFYPNNLNGGPFPVVTWGNGTGAIPEYYQGFLRSLASHGFIVIASRSMNTGSGREMIQGVDWLIAENNNPSSKFYGKIDTNNIGAAGHSQGGGGAIHAGADSRIKTTVLIQPATFGGNPANLKGPTFIISGGLDYIVSAFYIRSLVYGRTRVPTVYGKLRIADHLNLIYNPTAMSKYIIPWFEAQLKEDSQAENIFREGNGVFNDISWTVMTKRNNELF